VKPHHAQHGDCTPAIELVVSGGTHSGLRRREASAFVCTSRRCDKADKGEKPFEACPDFCC
jgi:hypothetical protein